MGRLPPPALLKAPAQRKRKPPGRPGARSGSPVPVGPFHGEGVGQVANFTNRTAGQKDFDNVEPDLDGGLSEQTQIVQARARQTSAPLGIDGGGGPAPFFRGTGFDLDEHQAVALPEDEVDLAAFGAEIGGQEFEAAAFEMPFGGALAEFAAAKVSRLNAATPPCSDAGE